MSTAPRPTVTIYTDGACDPNPGIGGWAAILIHPDTGSKTEITGGDPDSTNNRMELTAVIEALAQLKQPCVVTIVTDSEYVKNAFTQKWLEGWVKKGWKTASRQPVKNQDLWQKLLVLTQQHQIHWQWVRGHAFDALNNRCDELAVAARKRIAMGKGR
jgi:ribonuclease HI